MKLLYDLPQRESEKVKSIVGRENILYCLPFDLDASSKYTEGFFVITNTWYITLQNSEVKESCRIKSCSDFTLIKAAGGGTLEACIDGTERELVRFSNAHMPRFKYIAKVLIALSKGQELMSAGDEHDKVCSVCGRPYEDGAVVCRHCRNRKLVIKRFLQLLKPYWLTITITLLLFCVLTGLGLISPMLYRQLIDGYLSKRKAAPLEIFAIILIIGFTDLSRTLLDILKSRLVLKVGTSISRDMRKTVFAKIQSLSISYLDGKKSGDLMNRITGDTNTIQQFIANQGSFGIYQLLLMAVTTVVLFLMNWKLSILIMIPVPIIYYIWKLIGKSFKVMYHAQWKISDKCNSILHDILSGIKVVKAFGTEKREVTKFSAHSKRLADITARNEKFANTIFPMLTYAVGLGSFFILYYGGRLVLNKQMGLGELIQFTQYANMLYVPLGWLTFFPRLLTEAVTSTERVFEVLDVEPDIRDLAEAAPHDIHGNVIFDNISFGYSPYEAVLDNISLKVKEGEMIGLVGHSGSGKSTFINLLMRLYDVENGQIIIDGKNIKDIGMKDLRSQIGVVLQESFLFSGTVLQNIAYAKPDATLEEVINAAKIANAHDFIMKFPDGYDTKVGEKGHRLSGGERQRIAIARAILHNPKILILDEATASVDTETEYQIQEALGKLIENRTTIAIAHRLSTLRKASRLVVMDHGKQIEVGSHEELMEVKGKYYSLVMAQTEMGKIS